MAAKAKAKAKKNSIVDNLNWLVKHRSHNQETSLALFKALSEHSVRLKGNAILAGPGVTLTGASFSLWRAVFLADNTDQDVHRFEDAFKFLEVLISNNAISYAQDRKSREWTFHYYLNNARFRLEILQKNHPKVLPTFSYPNAMSHKASWEHLQQTVDLAVGNYVSLLNGHGQYP
jgi:hypothetical protein